MKNKLLGIGSILFPIYTIVSMGFALFIAVTVDPEAQIPDSVLPFLITGMIFLFISVIGIWFFIIYDIIHIAKNHEMSGGKKACWICGIWFLNIFVIPVYWFRHLKSNPKT